MIEAFMTIIWTLTAIVGAVVLALVTMMVLYLHAYIKWERMQKGKDKPEDSKWDY